ncbi:hypothetical protein BKE38_15305 [Pseudoroseomonas deserti]|uniref:OmpA-like domain-containing protein n=1 Tax=Teichococcus deserti TaxID=1817963 RepID=A0A1V2H0I2_9PROT|nr:hypothetical protein [Pseudoroseomonas deserti]ONG51899.1 hypothetical protein BKE38_15305 [Pseudoroseomonas deserti]
MLVVTFGVVCALVARPLQASTSHLDIFFPGDTTDYGQRGAQNIAWLAEHNRAIGRSCAELHGHSDLTGTPERRIIISRLRAEAVKQELLRLGFGRGCLRVIVKGSDWPLVNTAEGKPEVQNRRVTILPLRREDFIFRGGRIAGD